MRKLSRRGSTTRARRVGRPRGGALARRGTDLRDKHLRIDQRKLDAVRKELGVATEQEAIDAALSAFADNAAVRRALRAARGRIRFDESLLDPDVRLR